MDKKILAVLGGEVEEINKLAPRDTLRRCSKALRIWEDGNFSLIILTGGIFLPHKIQTRPVALIMKEWLIKQGVPEEKITAIPDAVDTFQDIAGLMDYLIKRNIANYNIVVVSHWQHVLRAFVTFSLAHHILIKPCPIFYWKGWKDFFREWFFCFYHLADWHGRGYLAKKNRAQRKKAASL